MVSNVKSVLDGYVQSHCSVSCASADPVVQEKKAATCIQHFGTDSYFKNEKAKQQIQATLIQKYGATHPMASAICRQKYEATNMKKYGTKWHIASKTVKEKSAQKNIAKLGVDNPWKCKAVQDKCRQRYRYDGQTFDSAPEIAFYIWLTDHHISFEYQPDVKLVYEHAGKKHFYVPDFKVGDQLIELKGDHFFKDGKMINPFRKSEWTDEQYADSCALYEAKHQCMLQNDVEVMTSDGYQKYLDYVAGKYGQNYLLQFKLNKQLDEQDFKHEQKKQPCCPK